MKSDLKELSKSFKVDLPYPRGEIEKKELSYCNLLKQCYAGRISELTITNQYLCHAAIIYTHYPDISETLRGISKINMLHLDILSDLLVSLGAYPDFCINKKNKNHYWSSKFISNSSSLKDILEEDIKIKRAAIDQYIEIADKISDDTIIATINRFILDEEYHIKLLHSLYNKYII